MGLFGNIARSLERAGRGAAVNLSPAMVQITQALSRILGKAAKVSAEASADMFGRIANAAGRILPTPPQEPLEFSDEDVFLFFEQRYTDFVSSNVFSFQYLKLQKRLIVGYKGRRSTAFIGYYEYLNVSEQEAREAFRALSKGGWVWDTLRIRGTKCGHQKEYNFLPGPSTWRPRKPCK